MTAMLRFSGLLGLTAVGAGAFNAHGLEKHWQANYPDMDDVDIARFKKTWNNGQNMHYFTAASMTALSAAAKAGALKRPIVAVLVGGGGATFAAACYATAYFTEPKFAMPAAPAGGSAVMLGWAALMLFP